MNEHPEPLVPPEVDLRDFDFMPLYGERLFNSDTWALCDADEKVAALRLWWRAWHEEPPGSLPNNDRLLADRAGYGVAVKAFLVVKENAMRGWIECADGRLYHPVVAAIALDVWQTKRQKETQNAADRERKKQKRRTLSGGQVADVRRTSGRCPADTTEETATCPPENLVIPPDKWQDKQHVSAGCPPDKQHMSAGVSAGCPPENALKRREVEDPPPTPPQGELLEFEFAEFWKIYPRRDDRGHALKAYRAARKKAAAGDIADGARRYAVRRRGQDPKFTALAATWLNGERWGDEGAEIIERPAFGAPGFA